MARTHRIRRKDLRRPDEFVTLSRRAFSYAEENRSTVLLVTAALIVLLAALLAYRAARTSREMSAAEAYQQARALFEDRKYVDAAAAFRRTVDSYPSTRYGGLAQLEAANALLLAERPGEAALGYQRFLDAGPTSEDLRQVALMRLGYAHEQTGKATEAQAAYAAAAGVPGPLRSEALLGEARAAELVGDGAHAQQVYERFLKDYRETDRAPFARARLIALGGRAPEVDGPPAADDEGLGAAGVLEGLAAPEARE